MPDATLADSTRRRHQRTYIAVAAVATLPGVILSRLHVELSDPVLALIFGLAIV